MRTTDGNSRSTNSTLPSVEPLSMQMIRSQSARSVVSAVRHSHRSCFVFQFTTMAATVGVMPGDARPRTREGGRAPRLASRDEDGVHGMLPDRPPRRRDAVIAVLQQ